MARKKKESDGGDDTPAWLITFSDLMTLLLTFFVLLLSMATMINERKRKIVLASISSAFGIGTKGLNILADDPSVITWEPGPFEDIDDLQFLKPLLWEDICKDVDLRTSEFVQVVSIKSDVLFDSGQVRLNEKGEKLLKFLAPLLARVSYPMRLSGHTSNLRDELGDEYNERRKIPLRDPSWEISMERTLAVYRFLITNGVKPEMLRMEAFGRFLPVASTATPEGRMQNRRVEILLDKRNSEWFFREKEKLGGEKPKKQEDTFEYKGFSFDLDKK